MTRHEGMIVWALAMFKRDWDVKSTIGVDGDKSGEVALQKFIGRSYRPQGGTWNLSQVMGKSQKYPFLSTLDHHLHGSRLSSKPLTLIYIDLWDFSAHNTKIGLKFACIVKLTLLFLPFTEKTCLRWPLVQGQPETREIDLHPR